MELRRQVDVFPSCFADGARMQQVASLGVIGSEAMPKAPARVATRILPPSAAREPHQVPIFTIFMRMGLVPPFSDFFQAILEAYELKLLHLTPTPSWI